MNAAMLLVRCLEHEGVRFIFGVPGEETLELTDACWIADPVVATGTNRPRRSWPMSMAGSAERRECAFPTLGPGATNLLTGVADAYLDHAPLVTITGQASLNRRHKESHQYIDAISMFKPVTKWNASIPRAEVIPEAVRKAFKIAQTEKPGRDPSGTAGRCRGGTIADEDAAESRSSFRRRSCRSRRRPKLQRAVRAISGRKRPVILAGNGVIRRSCASKWSEVLPAPSRFPCCRRSWPRGSFRTAIRCRSIRWACSSGLCGGRHGAGRCGHCHRL